MFEPQSDPRLFGLPPGVDFSAELISGLLDRLKGQPADAMARVDLIVSTRRMERRLNALFQAGDAQFLPRIHLLSDLSSLRWFPQVGEIANPLARRLQLAQLVKKLLEHQDDLAPIDAAFDLAGSLAALMEEMRGEGVDPSAIINLELSDRHSEYWARSKEFLSLVQTFFDDPDYVDGETHQRRTVELISQFWNASPPQNPIIIAGSTGSRGTSRALMKAVASLPQGAVIMPGYDFDMDAESWAALSGQNASEDHPQYRFLALRKALDLPVDAVTRWTDKAPMHPSRNKIVSLALRPAPVTDAWLTEGPNLTDILPATKNLSYLEAPSPRAEALAIALRLRKSVEDGIPAALITPDRVLTRQVSAALQRWDIIPDDSAGIPLSLTAPGRLLRQTARLMGQTASPTSILSLLKHPLVARGHRLTANDLELSYLRRDTPFPDRAGCREWAENQIRKYGKDASVLDWVDWLWDCLEPLILQTPMPMTDLVHQHLATTEALAAGPGASGSGELWDKEPGEKALETIENLRDVSPFGGTLTPVEYTRIVDSVFSAAEVRNAMVAHPLVMIWGTLEARVQGADLVILAGLNDGSWPELPKPDPWLNREMRQNAGLLLPERNIGLSAHDFQQAIATKEVLLTRAVRNADAETIPSRWLNRFGNLLEGLEDGKTALDNMRKRGKFWLDIALELERPTTQAPSADRPSPAPPQDVRPTELSITRIEKLIRDPYWIYAKYVLGLTPLDPFTLTPDAPLRGRVVHKVMEAFTLATKTSWPENPERVLMEKADEIFAREVPWPATRALWRAKLQHTADWFIQNEIIRRQMSHPAEIEQEGKIALDRLGFILKGRADRIDLTHAGDALIYDYKTGSPPSKDQQEFFDKQLPLTAAIAERGGFAKLGKLKVLKTTYIGLGSKPAEVSMDYPEGEIDQIWSEFEALIASYQDPKKGYASRRAVHERGFGQDYDTLARFGEWDDTDEAVVTEVGR